MILLCPICRTRLPVEDEKVHANAEVTCTLCDERFVADPSMAEEGGSRESTGSGGSEERSSSIQASIAASRRESSQSVPRVRGSFAVEDDPEETDEAPLVLVAHDSHSFCEHARVLLEDEGYEVAVVYDGDGAQSSLRSAKPRVAVLDAVLPKRLGTLITEDLKRSKSNVQVVLIASVYERYRIKREADPSLAPDGFVDPRNIDGELLPCIRKLTGIAPGALPSRRDKSRKPRAAVPTEIPRFEESLPPRTAEEVEDLEAQLRGLLEEESSVPPPDFDDDEDREIWEKILAEEGKSRLEPSGEVSLASASALALDSEESAQAPVSGEPDDGSFQPSEFLLDDDDDDDDVELDLGADEPRGESGLDDEEESVLLQLDSFDGADGEVSIDEEDEAVLDSIPLIDDESTGQPGESSLAISLDDDDDFDVDSEPGIPSMGDDVLRLDDLGTEPADPPSSAPSQTPATIDEIPEPEVSVSAELQIPVIDDDIELSAPRANAVVADPVSRSSGTPVLDDEDALIASLDSTLTPGDFDAGEADGDADDLDEFFDTSGLPPNVRDAHRKAQRLARIIVSDIVLYNQDRIAEAVSNNSFFEDLKGDIKDGREFFEEKVPPEVRSQCDYLQRMLESLVEEKRKELGL